MELNDSIVQLLTTYQYIAIFFGAFFFGETVIITAAFLAAKGLWSPITIFWLALLGTVISDSLWFFAGEKIGKKTEQWEKYQVKYKKFIVKLEKIFGQRPFLALLFIKFLYGTRIITIMYLSIQKIRFTTFLMFNTIGTTIWLVAMIALGWATAKGSTVLPIFDKLGCALTLLVAIIVLFKVGSLWIEKKIENE